MGVFDRTSAPCCWDGTENAGDSCVCGAEERVLRAYAGGIQTLPQMTEEQKKWCLDEIGQVEGYERREHLTDSDIDLANTVLRAWVDYCRDKGLL
jgi:hypothetical protein